MKFDPSRLRRGEVIVGAGAVVLLASMFALKWYGLSGPLRPAASALGLETSVNGWDGLTNVRWLLLVLVACAAALVFLQATRRTPALPVTFGVIVTVLGVLATLALLYRVLINQPGPNSLIDQKAGAFVGLLSTIALAYGGYRSLRQEGVAQGDAPAPSEIETLRLGSASRS